MGGEEKLKWKRRPKWRDYICKCFAASCFMVPVDSYCLGREFRARKMARGDRPKVEGWLPL